MSLPDWCEAEEWCPITVTSELLGRKWNPVIIHRLLENGKGFNELQRQANGISSKVLSESLEDLQEKDIVEKEVKKDDTKNVEYRLTEKGQSLRPVIMEMLKWGKENKENI